MKPKRINPTKILQITKLLITNNDKCIKYLNNEDNQIIKDQLPLIAQSKTQIPLTNQQVQLCRNSSLKHNSYTSMLNKCFFAGINLTHMDLRSLMKKKKPKSLMSKSTSVPSYYKSTTRLTSRMINDYLFDDLYKEDIDTLKYDEAEIFHKKDYYTSVIKDELNKLRNQYSNVNSNGNEIDTINNNGSDKDNNILNYSEFTRVLNKGHNRESKLTLKSITIKYTNTETSEQFSFNIPFTFLPIFYHQTKERNLTILLFITKFNDNYKRVMIDYAEFYNLIKNNSNYSQSNEAYTSKNCNSYCSGGNSNSNKPYNRFRQAQSQNNITFVSKIINKSPERSPMKIPTQTLITFNNIHPSEQKKAIKFLNKNTSTNNINVYNYLWVTPSSSFVVELSMPIIHLTFPSFKLQIKKYIDSELLLYIFIKQFNRWDYYILHYLFSFKSFRNIIDSLSSKKRSEYMQRAQTINITDTKISKYSKDDATWKGCYTNEKQENSLFKIKMVNLKLQMISNSNTANAKAISYKVHFSYTQSLLLALASKRVEVMNFIRKFIDITQNKPIFDYVKFDSFTENNLPLNDGQSIPNPSRGSNEKTKYDIVLQQALIRSSPLINNDINTDRSLEKEFEFENIEQMNDAFPYNLGGIIRSALAQATNRVARSIESKTKTSKNVTSTSPYLKKKGSVYEINGPIISQLQL